MLKRIKKYIDYKGISVHAFEKSIGMANASFGKSLRNSGTIGCDKLEIILKYYPDLNPEWVTTGVGNMLRTDEKPENTLPYIMERYEAMAALNAALKKENEHLKKLLNKTPE